MKKLILSVICLGVLFVVCAASYKTPQCQFRTWGKYLTSSECFFDDVVVGSRSGNLVCARVAVDCY